MSKIPKKGRKDINQTAFAIVQQATGEIVPEKENATHESGRRNSGIARAKKLTPEQRIDAARVAANARWKKK